LKYGHRLVIDTILYVLVSGCAWRLVPHVWGSNTRFGRLKCGSVRTRARRSSHAHASMCMFDQSRGLQRD
jgi:transposase